MPDFSYDSLAQTDAERLQEAINRLLEGQDNDTVNESFSHIFCGDGQFARVDFDKHEADAATLTINHEETGVVSKLRFRVKIELVG